MYPKSAAEPPPCRNQTQPSTQNTHRLQPTCLLHGRAPAPHTQGCLLHFQALILVWQGGPECDCSPIYPLRPPRTWPPHHGVTSVPARPTSPTPDNSLELAGPWVLSPCHPYPAPRLWHSVAPPRAQRSSPSHEGAAGWCWPPGPGRWRAQGQITRAAPGPCSHTHTHTRWSCTTLTLVYSSIATHTVTKQEGPNTLGKPEWVPTQMSPLSHKGKPHLWGC